MQTFCLLKELLCIGGHVYCTDLQTEDEASKRKKCKQAEKFSWIVYTLVELRLWNLLSGDYTGILFILHWMHKLHKWDECELLLGSGVINGVATVCLCCTRAAAWQEVNSSSLRMMRGPECEGGFICLFGHVCWAGGFYLNNSTPTYRERDLPDRDQLHPHHREPGRRRRQGTTD